MRSARLFACLCLIACGTVFAAEDAARPAPSTLKRVSGPSSPVDSRGFIQRWRVLEPVPVPGRLTESGVQDALRIASLPNADAAPADGATTTINGATLTWHALDTTNYNVNLYHFAWSLSKPTSNVLFWAEVAVDSPREMSGVRLAIGSNAASRWWLNGEPVIALNDDRQTVIDDGVSKRVTLRKGRNVIRAAIVNGGGATDFCARFLNEDGLPVTDLRAVL